MPRIDKFEGVHRFLSNFYPCCVELDDEAYPSVEHAYQAAKTFSIECRERLQNHVVTAAQAKKMGKRFPLRSDWGQVKLDVMLKLLRQKFRTPRLRVNLESTGDVELVEGNWWGDTFWGVCNGVGENWLGKLLMQVREEIRNESKGC